MHRCIHRVGVCALMLYYVSKKKRKFFKGSKRKMREVVCGK